MIIYVVQAQKLNRLYKNVSTTARAVTNNKQLNKT